MIIGTTGKIQLDIYRFRIWKSFAKRFSDIVLLLESNINLHERNNIIKLQSLIHNQLSISQRYHNLFEYLKLIVRTKDQKNLKMK